MDPDQNASRGAVWVGSTLFNTENSGAWLATVNSMNAIVGTCLKHVCTQSKNKKGAFTNSVDPDEMPHNAASH